MCSLYYPYCIYKNTKKGTLHSDSVLLISISLKSVAVNISCLIVETLNNSKNLHKSVLVHTHTAQPPEDNGQILSGAHYPPPSSSIIEEALHLLNIPPLAAPQP